MTYFYATTGSSPHPLAFLLVKIEDEHCQLHGERTGRKMIYGRRIKTSGKVAGTTWMLDESQIHHDSRHILSPERNDHE